MNVTETAVVCFCLISGGSAWAGDFEVDSAGVRGGLSANDPEKRFYQAESFARISSPWLWNLGREWNLTPKLDLSAGCLTGRGETGFIGTVGPVLSLSRERSPLSFGLGISPTIMSRETYGNKDFGTLFEFTSSLGLGVKLSPRFNVGLRFQHMSNAGLSTHNPGLNLGMISVGYRF